MNRDNRVRYSVIDCGSNSFRIIIAEVFDKKIQELYRDIKMVQLGLNLHITGGIIDNKTMQRCLAALDYFKSLSLKYNCNEIFCVGTSALRSAANADFFCQKVSDQLGIVIHIIDGSTEAWYSFSGATGYKTLKQGIAVLDIGGGSSELAVSTGDLLLSCSIPAGSVRMVNVFCSPEKKMSKDQLVELSDYVKKLWNTHWDKEKYPIKRFIGVAGTITTLAAIKHKMEEYNPEKINGTQLTYSEIENMLTWLNSLTVEQRVQVFGLSSLPRAETIVSGAGILLASMEYWHQDRVEVRDSSLLQGLLFDRILTKNY